MIKGTSGKRMKVLILSQCEVPEKAKFHIERFRNITRLLLNTYS